MYSGRPHHKFGCLFCGKRRDTEDILNKTYDVYLKDEKSNSLMRVGLCKDCFEKENLCLDEMQKRLHWSKKCCAEEKGMECDEKFENARFVGRMSYENYWKEAGLKTPKLSSQFLEIVPNAR